MIVEKINKFLSEEKTNIEQAIVSEFALMASESFRRQFITDREERNGISMSSCGKCPRALAYKFHGFKEEGKEIDTRGKMTFFFGDMVENAIVAIANLAGCAIESTGKNQLEVVAHICGNAIKGHPDGIIGERLFECKSMNDMAYQRFERGEIDDTYRAQANMYMMKLGLKECIMLAMNKNTSVLGELIIKFDPKIVSNTIESIESVVKSTKDILPEPRFTANDKGFYPWNCLYCAYWGHCKPNAKKVLVGKAYKLKESKC